MIQQDSRPFSSIVLLSSVVISFPSVSDFLQQKLLVLRNVKLSVYVISTRYLSFINEYDLEIKSCYMFFKILQDVKKIMLK